MQKLHEYATLDDAYLTELAGTVSLGSAVSPRSLATVERTDCAFRLTNPRARLIYSPARKWSPHYAIGELLWHLAASNNVQFIAYYSERWLALSENGHTITGSCYGHKILGHQSNAESRWEQARRLLLHDPDTRRCVITLYDRSEFEIAAVSKDVPCCNLIQFLVRDGQLCLVNYMRSNDLMYGLAYDVFLFTVFQEMMALELKLPVGWYGHVVGSLHLYKQDWEWATRVAVCDLVGERRPMPAMSHLEELPRVLEYEKEIRESTDV